MSNSRPAALARVVLFVWVWMCGAVVIAAPDGWNLAFEDDFSREAFDKPSGWWILQGTPAVRDGAMHGPAYVVLDRAEAGNQRLELTCASETADYIPIELGSPYRSGLGQNGYWFGFRVGAKESRLYLRGNRVQDFPRGERGQPYRIACQIEDHTAVMWVNDQKVAESQLTPTLYSDGGRYVLIRIPAKAWIDDLRLYTRGAVVQAPVGQLTPMPFDRPTHDPAGWKLDVSHVTPHIPYGRPLAAGPVRALFSVWACAARGVVELQQRLDLVASFAPEGPNNLLWRGHAVDTGGSLTEVAMNQQHDVIVIGGLPWRYYPKFLQRKILEQVESGTGLVFSHDSAPKPEDGLLFKLFEQSTQQSGPFPSERCRATTHGKGRVAFVILTEPSPNDAHLKFFTGYEERGVEQFARTLLWAAGREPGVLIQPDEPPIEPASAQESLVRKISIHNAGDAFVGTVEVAPRRDLTAEYPLLYGSMFYQFRPYESWETVSIKRQPIRLAAGEATTVNVELGELGAGIFQVTVTMRDHQDRVVSWRNLPVQQRSAPSLAEIQVASKDGVFIRADERTPSVCFSAGEPVRIRLLTEGQTSGARIRLSVLDRSQRLLWRGEGNCEDTFTLDMSRALHRLAIVRAELVAGSRILDELRAPIAMLEDPARAPSYRMRTYGCSLLRPDLTTFSISYRKGLRVTPEEAALQHAWHDMRIGEFSHVVPMAKEISGDFVRTPSIHNPQFRASQMQWVRDFLNPVAGFGWNLLLCDEWSFPFIQKAGENHAKFHWPSGANQDQSEHGRAAYRKYLRDKYGSIAELNRVWSTSHQDWDQITPPIYDADPAKYPQEKDWPGIIDHRSFIDDSFSRYIRDVADLAASLSPALNIGTSGHYHTGMFTGRDYYVWARYAPHVVTYRDHLLWQSLTPQQVGVWMGYGMELRDPAKESARAWESLFMGVEHAYWGREAPPFRPDFAMLPAPQRYFEQRRLMQDSGIADTITNARGANRIAILYHPRSFFVYSLKDWSKRGAAFIQDVTAVNRYGDYLGKYWEGFPAGTHHWVDLRQFASDDFGRHGKPAVLVLPQTESLSDDEAALLRRYVAEGGILVADLNPGVRDEHGRPRPNGALDDLLGITSGHGTTTSSRTEQAHGKGRTVYLGKLPTKPDDFDQLLQLANATPDWKLIDGPVRTVSLAADFRREDQLFIGCAANSPLPATVTGQPVPALQLRSPRHVYDMLRGEFLGETDRIEMRFESPHRMANVYACLPYRVESVRMADLPQAAASGIAVSLAASLLPTTAAERTHSLRIQWFDPQGVEQPLYRIRVETNKGIANVTTPFAMNTATGAWRVRVTDIASGVHAEQAVEIMP